jgi:hypothetical protein
MKCQMLHWFQPIDVQKNMQRNNKQATRVGVRKYNKGLWMGGIHSSYCKFLTRQLNNLHYACPFQKNHSKNLCKEK